MVEQSIAGWKGGRIKRARKHLTNTQIITRCPHCNCITYTMMDDDGNRFCGKCKERKPR